MRGSISEIIRRVGDPINLDGFRKRSLFLLTTSIMCYEFIVLVLCSRPEEIRVTTEALELKTDHFKEQRVQPLSILVHAR